MGSLTHALAVEMFHEQAEGLKEGGADVLWVETISAAEEFQAAAEACALAGMPWCGTMSFDTAGRTMMGLTSAQMVSLVGRLSNPPLAFGANCGVGASDLMRTIMGFMAAAPELPVIAKGNAGIPKYHDGHIHYDGTPELMGEYACLARDAGATIIGGCCGTMPEHLAAMRKALEEHPRGARPTLDEIAEKLGGFSSAKDGHRRRRSARTAQPSPRIGSCPGFRSPCPFRCGLQIFCEKICRLAPRPGAGQKIFAKIFALPCNFIPNGSVALVMREGKGPSAL